MSDSLTPDPDQKPAQKPKFSGPPPVPGRKPAGGTPPAPAPAGSDPGWQPQVPPPPSGAWRPSAPPPPGQAAASGPPPGISPGVLQPASFADPAPAADLAAAALGIPGQQGVPVSVRPLRRPPPRRSGELGGLVAIFALLFLAVGGLGFYFLWQRQQEELAKIKIAAREAIENRQPAVPVTAAPPVGNPGPRRKPSRAEAAAASQGSGALADVLGPDETRQDSSDRPAPRVAQTAGPRGRPAMADDRGPEPAAASPPAGTASMARPAAPEPPAVPQPPAAPATAPKEVEDALGAAYAAMRAGDFAAAERSLAGLSPGDDEALGRRLNGWKSLLFYARGHAELRSKAYAAAAGGEFTIGDRVIIVVEIDSERIVYRDSGKQKRVPLAEIPSAVDRAIVEQWLAADGRAANHLFLGAGHLVRERPSPADATREWGKAAAGGERERAAELQPLVDDPVIVGAE